MINVAIIFEGYSSRKGIRNFIADKKINIIGEAGNGSAGLKLIQKNQPDIAIIGLGLPDMTGTHLCELIDRKFPKTKVIFLLTHLHLPTLSFLTDTSAKGFITLNYYSGVEAIKIIHDGGCYIQPDISLNLMKYIKNGMPGKLEVLSAKEYKVLFLVANKKTHEEIAELCHISLKTVSNLKSAGMRKLEIKTGDVDKLQELILDIKRSDVI